MPSAPFEIPEEARIPEDLVRAKFDEWIGEHVKIAGQDGTELHLKIHKTGETVATEIRKNGGFYVEFLGPTDRYFNQQTVKAELPDGRIFAFFFVNTGPAGPEGEMLYQVVFN